MSSRGTMLAPMSKVKIEVKVNGEIRQADVDPRIPLVQLLRDELGLTGTHIGCLTGHCGACTVLLNGSAVKSCTVLAASANGDEIRTVEGLADGDLHPVQKAFWDHQGFQCGYCTPGMIMATLELLRENPDPNDNEIKAGISGNLCRCTGYQTIIQAVRGAAEALRRNPHWLTNRKEKESAMATKAEAKHALRTIKAEPLTREAFAPFGDVLSMEGLRRLPIELYGDRIDVYRPALFESDQPVEFLLTRSKLREFRIIFIERHLELTQSFIPLGGHPFIVVVARPNAREEDGIPALDEIHAFFVPGDTGINIHRGTWHEVPLPLVDGALMLVTSHQALTQGLESKLSERHEIHKLDVEKRNVTERTGLVLRVELP